MPNESIQKKPLTINWDKVPERIACSGIRCVLCGTRAVKVGFGFGEGKEDPVATLKRLNANALQQCYRTLSFFLMASGDIVFKLPDGSKMGFALEDGELLFMQITTLVCQFSENNFYPNGEKLDNPVVEKNIELFDKSIKALLPYAEERAVGILESADCCLSEKKGGCCELRGKIMQSIGADLRAYCKEQSLKLEEVKI